MRVAAGGALVLGSVLLSLVFVASAAALPNYTWSGTTSSSITGSIDWSLGANWGGAAPSGAVGTLSFPELDSTPGCGSVPYTSTCYNADNDISGLDVGSLSIDDGEQYRIGGSAITLDGGITAAPSSSDVNLANWPDLSFPITLGADQTWSLTGGSEDQGLILAGDVTGSGDTLKVDLSTSLLTLFGDDEVGDVTVGTGASGLPGTLELSGQLNSTDENTISFTGGTGLLALDADTGPLSLTGGEIQVGAGLTSTGDSTLDVNGALSVNRGSNVVMEIDAPGAAGTDYSQVSATGNITLGTSTGLLLSGFSPGMTSECPTLNVGDVDTLLTASGTLSGTFANLPDGSIATLNCTNGVAPTVRINYTANSVTATVLTSGSSGPSFTWSGAGTPGSNWSSGSNWVGGAAPGGAVGTVAFPALTGPACTTQPQIQACGTSADDLSGLSVSGISVDDGSGYDLTGSDPLTIGSGGISTTDTSGENQASTLGMPIALGASQSWTIGGGTLNLDGGVIGSGSLAVDLSGGGALNLGAAVDVGSLDFAGGSTSDTGASAADNGTVTPTGLVSASVMNLSDAALEIASSQTIGGLDSTGAAVQVGDSSESAILTVNGPLSLDPASQLTMFVDGAGGGAGSDYSQVNASGNVSLAGSLQLVSGPSCSSLTTGSLDTLLSTTGALSGTFSDAANGAQLAIYCGGVPVTVTINYTPTSVTMTVDGAAMTLANGYAETAVCTAGPCSADVFDNSWTITSQGPSVGAFAGTVTTSDGYTGTFTGTVAGATVTVNTSIPADGGYTARSSGTIAADGAMSGTFADSLGDSGTWSAAPLLQPVSTGSPTVSGTPTVGGTLACSTGQWSNAPTTFTFHWARNGASIAGAISSTYTVAGSDLGAALTCVVTASNAAGAASATSAAVDVARPPGTAPNSSGVGSNSGGGGSLPPTLGATSTVGLVTGTVLVRLPGSRAFAALTPGARIPLGATFNALNGTVQLIFARRSGGTMSATYAGGEFVTSQTRQGEVIAILAGGNFSSCPRHHGLLGEAASRRPVRKLWATDHGGNFGTKGTYVATTVEGTHWLTEDFCDGSEAYVQRGVVLAINLITHRKRLLHAGHTYFAAA